MKIVLASNNAGKIRELGDLLSHLSIDLIPQAALNIEEVEETGLTFIENALIKARHASRMANMPAIADDSGLVVNALQGAPGIYSARYAGVKIAASEHNQKLLNALKDVPDEKRTAFFHCVLVYLAHADDPTPLVCSASWHGMILHQPQGTLGFGYDPVFYVPSEKTSAAELPAARKNSISHRGMALKSLLALLPEKI